KITRNGNITAVGVQPERFDRRFEREIAFVDFHVRYRDGSEFNTFEGLEREWGNWKLCMINIVPQFAPEFDRAFPAKAKLNLAAIKCGLDENYTLMPRTRFSLRLPKGCKAIATTKAFEHPDLEFAIAADFSLFRTSEAVLQRIEKFWSEPNRKIL